MPSSAAPAVSDARAGGSDDDPFLLFGMPEAIDEAPHSTLQYLEVTTADYPPTEVHKVSPFRKFVGRFLMIELPRQRILVQV